VKIFFEVESDLKALDRVLGHFDRLERAGIARKDWLQCQLALVEGFTNAVRHAHKDLPAEIPIEVEVELTPTGMELRIWDRGLPFDLEGFLREKAGRDTDLSGRGQGIPILRKVASRLVYQRTPDGRNCLWLVKSFSPPPADGRHSPGEREFKGEGVAEGSG
jgi:serine/threonine-protein kinase RsbW